jgi:hypothetical protein
VTLVGDGVQARLWYLAGPRLRVDLGTATLILEKGSRGGITIVVNTGRAATTISRWFVRNVDGTDQLGPDGLRSPAVRSYHTFGGQLSQLDGSLKYQTRRHERERKTDVRQRRRCLGAPG